jgi:hypothetical protein
MQTDQGRYTIQQIARAGADTTGVVQLRASDADREQTAELLRHHYGLGRLGLLELDERISRCFAATTVAELRELVADLPRGAVRAPELERRRDFRRLPTQPVRIIPFLIAFALLAGLIGGHALWLIWPLVFIVLRGRLATFAARNAWVRRQG